MFHDAYVAPHQLVDCANETVCLTDPFLVDYGILWCYADVLYDPCCRLHLEPGRMPEGISLDSMPF